uniref:Uncharacterized protein n=1 Tax=Anopheles atroparvus TaxID=41427 RepID=A0AAG5CUY1_ANOAO
MKLTLVFVLALALFSLASASPLLVTKHLVKKALLKTGHHALSSHLHAKSAGHVVQEVHYVAHPPPVHYAPVAVPYHSHGGYKHY